MRGVPRALVVCGKGDGVLVTADNSTSSKGKMLEKMLGKMLHIFDILQPSSPTWCRSVCLIVLRLFCQQSRQYKATRLMTTRPVCNILKYQEYATFSSNIFPLESVELSDVSCIYTYSMSPSHCSRTYLNTLPVLWITCVISVWYSTG